MGFVSRDYWSDSVLNNVRTKQTQQLWRDTQHTTVCRKHTHAAVRVCRSPRCLGTVAPPRGSDTHQQLPLVRLSDGNSSLPPAAAGIDPPQRHPPTCHPRVSYLVQRLWFSGSVAPSDQVTARQAERREAYGQSSGKSRKRDTSELHNGIHKGENRWQGGLGAEPIYTMSS